MVGDDRLERGDHPRLHRRERLAARERRPRRRALHDLPEVGLREVGELPAGPLAVVGLDHAVERAARRARGASATASAVCVVRSIGLAYTAATGSAASRSPSAAAWRAPLLGQVDARGATRQQRTGLRGDGVAHEHEPRRRVRGARSTAASSSRARRAQRCPSSRRCYRRAFGSARHGELGAHITVALGRTMPATAPERRRSRLDAMSGHPSR